MLYSPRVEHTLSVGEMKAQLARPRRAGPPGAQRRLTAQAHADVRRRPPVARRRASTPVSGEDALRRHAVASGQPTVQATPFTVKALGAVLVPECDPLNPMSVLAPGARVAFHPSPVAVTADPVWAHVALQPWVTFWPEGSVNASPTSAARSTCSSP